MRLTHGWKKFTAGKRQQQARIIQFKEVRRFCHYSPLVWIVVLQKNPEYAQKAFASLFNLWKIFF